MRLPAKVKLVEVSARDGLQNEPAPVPADVKVELIERLANTGLKSIEAGSFVHPDRVPQMADTAEVLSRLTPRIGVAFPVLVPNMKGLEAAIASGVKEIAVFASASETFAHNNLNCSIEKSLERIWEVVVTALARRMKVRGYVSCALGCPYEGEIAPRAVARVAGALYKMGCYEISLGDTMGVGTPGKTQVLVYEVAKVIPVTSLAGHFHDTFGQALANILAVMECGVATFDSSVAGLGGCPFAPGATGNISSEDLLYMLDGMGIKTGVNMDALIDAGEFICEALNRPTNSRVAKAKAASRRAAEGTEKGS